MLSYPYDKKNIEEFQNDPFKQYSSPSHASTCMLEGVVFPAICPHATVPTNSGGRISLQLQVEPNCGGFFPDIYPESIKCGILMDDNDVLFQFMKGTNTLILFFLFSFFN